MARDRFLTSSFGFKLFIDTPLIVRKLLHIDIIARKLPSGGVFLTIRETMLLH